MYKIDIGILGLAAVLPGLFIKLNAAVNAAEWRIYGKSGEV